MLKNYTRSDFDYKLPVELIAQKPLAQRSASRLLHIEKRGAALSHYFFSDILGLLQPEDLLVINNAKVVPARMFGIKETGGQVECLVERVLDKRRALVQLRASKSPKVGGRLIMAEGQVEATVLGRRADLFELHFDSGEVLDLLTRYGQLPLPPYIQRAPNDEDQNGYQTIFASKAGAVAAPTAGLHFDAHLLEQIKNKGIDIAETTLYVGAGTFQPVRVENLAEHHMHSECLILDQVACDAIQDCKARGGRVVAVGTTVVRVLESIMAKRGKLTPYQGETNLFIYPGFQFQIVDALITNFHLPQSTLLMLVSAFAGCQLIQKAYKTAIEKKYRFFSYGDAMLIT